MATRMVHPSRWLIDSNRSWRALIAEAAAGGERRNQPPTFLNRVNPPRFTGLDQLSLLGAAAVMTAASLPAMRDLFKPYGRNAIVMYLAFFLSMAATRSPLLKTGLNVGIMAPFITAADVVGSLVLFLDLAWKLGELSCSSGRRRYILRRLNAPCWRWRSDSQARPHTLIKVEWRPTLPLCHPPQKSRKPRQKRNPRLNPPKLRPRLRLPPRDR